MRMWDGTENKTYYLQCPIFPYSCTQEDIINANDNAKDVVQF